MGFHGREKFNGAAGWLPTSIAAIKKWPLAPRQSELRRSLATRHGQSETIAVLDKFDPAGLPPSADPTAIAIVAHSRDGA